MKVWLLEGPGLAHPHHQGEGRELLCCWWCWTLGCRAEGGGGLEEAHSLGREEQRRHRGNPRLLLLPPPPLLQIPGSATCPQKVRGRGFLGCLLPPPCLDPQASDPPPNRGFKGRTCQGRGWGMEEGGWRETGEGSLWSLLPPFLGSQSSDRDQTLMALKARCARRGWRDWGWRENRGRVLLGCLLSSLLAVASGCRSPTKQGF